MPTSNLPPGPLKPPGPDEKDGSSGVERRRASRHSSDMETTCQPVGSRDSATWDGWCRDISTSGIGLILSRRFEPGTLLAIDVENPAQGVSYNVLARVIHATAQEDGTWRLGCAFARELAEEDLQPFCAGRMATDAADVRAWVRFSCDVPMICRRAARNSSAEWKGKIVDVAPGGIGIVIPLPLETGTALTIELALGQDESPRTFLVRVAQTPRQTGTDWLLGCEFTRSFTDVELTQLLGVKIETS
jgi:PilZ domain